jgi:ParB family chromosome partitioning protein
MQREDLSNATYGMIDVKLITPSPMNPRKNFPGPKLDELIASIKLKGVIQPIVIRPVEGKEAPYEIVVGERRYKASIEAGCTGIPAIVREMTDDEAYDFMLIENLHREDLTEREEADSFKAYTDRHGDDGIVALAEKTGIKPGYIRSRICVLELPDKVLKAWDKGDLAFGHLQQLLRVTDQEALKGTIKWVLDRWHNITPSVKALAAHIDEEAPPLSSAFFSTKEICGACGSNTMVQRELFGIEAKKAHCLDPACFKEYQKEWLTDNWKVTAIAKKNGTNGFRFQGDVSYRDIERFYDWNAKSGKKCHECPDFVSIIEITGKVRDDEACAGDKACYRALTDPKTAKEKKTGERDPEAPRAAWHGEYFRDVFLSKRIPEVLAGIDPDDERIKELLLACAIHGNRQELGEQGYRHDYSGWILAKTAEEKKKAFKKVVEEVILSGQHVGPSEYNGFGTKGRQLVARYLGIDLAREFAVDKDYLEKKTKAEIVAFGKKFKLLDPAQVSKLKKTELIKLILNHGDKLVGKVPAEILKGESRG